MLQSIVSHALARRGMVAILAAALVLYGIWTAANAKLDVLPDFAPPQVTIQTEAPGFAPDQVELLVTLPIETALGGEDLARVRAAGAARSLEEGEALALAVLA